MDQKEEETLYAKVKLSNNKIEVIDTAQIRHFKNELIKTKKFNITGNDGKKYKGKVAGIGSKIKYHVI